MRKHRGGGWRGAEAPAARPQATRRGYTAARCRGRTAGSRSDRTRHHAAKILRAQSRPRIPAIGVLCSGNGTNLQAILDACRAGRLRARVAVVLSDQPNAYALVRAHRAGVAAEAVEPQGFGSRAACERRMIQVLDAHRVRLVCLAGFMRILSPVFVRHFRGRILNIHPALLPAFPGAHAVREALARGVHVTGVTVHLVDEQVDHGPIVAQAALAVRLGETEAALLARVHRLEHRLYPQAIARVLSGDYLKMSRRVLGRSKVRPVGG